MTKTYFNHKGLSFINM